MKKQHFLSVLIMTFLLLGCTPPERPTATLPILTITPNPTPTAIEEPATPTLLPEAGLRTNGPYFAYFRQVPGFDASQFVLMDADGGGRKVIDVPDEITASLAEAYYGHDARFVSPDGKWLAFYTGYAGEFYGGATQSTFDLTLNLLNFETGNTQIITPLLSNDYPDNFAQAVKEINDPLIRPEDLQTAFLAGITQALAWSPDGMHLAFAGQMDSLSSDLYLYDMSTKGIQRLSSENEQLQWVRWSPDGKWILHGSRMSSIDEWIEYSIYAVARDNSSIRNLGYGFASDWLNSHEFLMYRSGTETYQLRLVNVDAGNITEVWEGYFYSHNVDPTGNWIVLDAISSSIPPDEEKPGFVPGIKLINLRSLETIRNPEPLSNLPDLFVRANDGTVIDLPNRIETILASPDKKYWAVARSQSIKIYTQPLTLVKEVSVPLHDTNLSDIPRRPDDMQWRPDSSGLFLVYATNIYSVNISNGDINLVETNLPFGYDSTSRWINSQ